MWPSQEIAMRMDDSRESSNIEDRRGRGVRRGSIGLGAIVLALVAVYFGIDPSVVLQMADSPPARQAPQTQDGESRFVARVLGETEDTWDSIFKQNLNRKYEAPKLVLFSGATPTACGTGQSAMGPFYCPLDSKVYLDLSFFEDMKRKLNAPGDFARAYVIAHEVGHHVQNLLGIAEQVGEARRRNPALANSLSVRLELQADCFAGLWARRADQARHILEAGDIESGINAASAIGDDTLQRKSQGYVVPDAFTHGSSAQRVRWFKRGLDSGDLRQCNTFATQEL
ncbi:neutral zinc metallopeptidase [Bordetella avium]|nr:neutral zinc metallopeptidase [Bordetella avium]